MPDDNNRNGRYKTIALCAVLLVTILGIGCRQDMQDQPKYKPLQPSSFFEDDRSARPQVEGTVALGQLREDTLLYTGRVSAPAAQPAGAGPQAAEAEQAAPVAQTSTAQAFSNVFPFPVTREVVDRGQERYNIYCSMCHGATGDGLGMVVRRGYRQPPALYIERLKNAPAGYFFDVITNGFGAMPDYAAQIPVRDRWAIVAYLRALQLSQQAPVADLSAEDRQKLEQQKNQGQQK